MGMTRKTVSHYIQCPIAAQLDTMEECSKALATIWAKGNATVISQMGKLHPIKATTRPNSACGCLIQDSFPMWNTHPYCASRKVGDTYGQFGKATSKDHPHGMWVVCRRGAYQSSADGCTHRNWIDSSDECRAALQLY